jgi:prepilin-type processing-associated H-X9-DG protein
MILPYMEQPAIYNAINFGLTMTLPHNETVQTLRISSYLCPSDNVKQLIPVRNEDNTETVYTVGSANYVGVYGTGEIGEAPGRGDGMFFRNGRLTFGDITDGTSQTFFIGERSHNLSYVTWTGRAIGGWLFTTASFEGGTNKFDPEPEESFTMILGPIEAEEGNPRTPNYPAAHVEDYWSRHSGGVNFLFGGRVRPLHQEHHPHVRLSFAGDASRRRDRGGGPVLSG